ncbi:MAG TPA: tetratricopeptide repeat protein, partial [Firmicutes bacterium]|nr:tetratricopeptide repeat protein [Bacillota bacterium]
METDRRFITVFILLLLIPVFLFSFQNPVEKAKEFYDKGQYDEALKVFRGIKRTYPGSDWEMQADFMTALIYEKQEKPAEAEKAYVLIAEKYPKTAAGQEAYFKIARIRETAGDRQSALAAYKNYLNNYMHGDMRSMALFNMAAIHKDLDESKNALKIYNELLMNYKNDLWMHSWAAIYSGHIY